MIYFFNLVYSSIYGIILGKIKKIKLVYFFPIIFLWTLIIGGQYDTGTDYFSYLNIYQNTKQLNMYYEKNEYLFYYFILYLKKISKQGQLLFFSVGILESILFCHLVIKLEKMEIIKKKYIGIYIFLFLAYGTNFYNQMNGIRQYFNIYIFTYLILYGIQKKKFFYNLNFLIGLNIHRSFIILYPFYFIFKKIEEKITYKRILIFMLLAILLNFINLEKLIKEFLKFFPRYSNYIESEYLRQIDLTNKLTKFIYFPFYLISFKYIKEISCRNKIFFLKLGIISYILKIVFLVTSLTNRLGEYFSFLAIYPIYYLLEIYIIKRKKIRMIFILSIVFIIFIIKVFIVPKNEYNYKSIFFIAKL